jgi:membrane associated rhomboid family serine protease
MNLPPVTKNLIIINALLFFATFALQRVGIDLTNLLGLHFFLAPQFKLHQLFTYMFMHGGFEHILFNMFAVWMFGRVLEQVWGSKRFLIFYIVCGVGAGLCQEVAQYASYLIDGLNRYEMVNTSTGLISMSDYLNLWTTVGASGAIYGILLAFGMTFPNQPIYIYFLFPIRAKYFVAIYAALELLLGLAQTGDGVAHFAHLGGMLFGLLLILYWRKKYGNHGGPYYY